MAIYSSSSAGGRGGYGGGWSISSLSWAKVRLRDSGISGISSGAFVLVVVLAEARAAEDAVDDASCNDAVGEASW